MRLNAFRILLAPFARLGYTAISILQPVSGLASFPPFRMALPIAGCRFDGTLLSRDLFDAVMSLARR